MLVGALVGAVFVLHVAIALPLVTALVVLVGVAVGAHLLGRGDADWVRP
jgi:xanthosine utilization system XapX-like protein